MKKLLSALFVLALCASAAMATVPDPTKCSVSPEWGNGLMLCPDSPSPINGTTYTITVRNSINDPIVGAAVVIELGAAMEVCTSATHSGTTIAGGICTITLKGGGCIHATAAAAVVKANGIVIKSYNNCKSPDNATDGTSNATGIVDLSDLVAFKNQYFGTWLPKCHDFDTNGLVNLGDQVPFGQAFSVQHTCTLVP